uniref:Uncharacterized protein n=1 Tax=Oryza meridionalis TaxID=40149 RepID=A0A0E0EJA2_9ORYZ
MEATDLATDGQIQPGRRKPATSQAVATSQGSASQRSAPPHPPVIAATTMPPLTDANTDAASEPPARQNATLSRHRSIRHWHDHHAAADGRRCRCRDHGASEPPLPTPAHLLGADPRTVQRWRRPSPLPAATSGRPTKSGRESCRRRLIRRFARPLQAQGARSPVAAVLAAARLCRRPLGRRRGGGGGEGGWSPPRTSPPSRAGLGDARVTEIQIN